MKRSYFIFVFVLFALGTKAEDNKDVLSVNAVQKYFLIADTIIEGMVDGVELSEPFGLAKDFKGDIYVSDASNDRILKYSSDLKFIKSAGSYGSGYGGFNHPTFMNFDNGLNLMISDEENRRISRYNTDLTYVDKIEIYDENEPLKYGKPSGVAFTPYGETWVCDNEQNQILVFNNIGQLDRLIGDYGYEGDRLTNPEKIFITKDKNFLVADAGGQRLVFYDQYGNFIREIKMDYAGYPIAAVKNDDMIWALDHYTGAIFGLSDKGELLVQSQPILPGDSKPLKNPTDLMLLEDGKLIIADSQNNRLIVVKIILNE